MANAFLSFFKSRMAQKPGSKSGDPASLLAGASIALQGDDPQRAVQLCDALIAQGQDCAEAHHTRASAFVRLGQLDRALADYDCIIALDSRDYLAHANRGAVLRKLKRFEDALASYDRAVLLKVDHPEGYFYRGVVLHEIQRYEEALESYEKAIELTPVGSLPYVAYLSRGYSLLALNRFQLALDSFEQAVAGKNDYAEAFNGRGLALHHLRRYQEAAVSFEKAIECGAADSSIFRSLGLSLRHLKRMDESLASYTRAIDLDPECAEAYVDRANVLLEVGSYEDALANYECAVQLSPESVEARQGRGFALLNLRRLEAAIASIDEAIALNPAQKYLLGLRRHLQMQICDWKDLEIDLERLVAGLDAGRSLSTPFPMLSLIDSPSVHRSAATLWAEEQYPEDTTLGPISKRPSANKIHVAYFSPDFRNHPISLLTAELFETHDRSRFFVTAFSFGPRSNDPVCARLERAFDRFIDVRTKSDFEVAELARKMEVDVAVDLAGYTEHCRTGIFALRAAPIQVSYLGYLGTMSAPYMDYLLADATTIPTEEQRHYSEKIIYLPSYQANDSKRQIADRLFSREELGLPREGFVFACFNANYKIAPSTFSVWMRILRRVPASVLFLYAGDDVTERNIRSEAERRGVEAHRMVFGKKLAFEEYLARFRAMDLFLDTLPYNAGTTGSDALWAGLPVLTCMGRAFAGRVAASLLTAINLPELITNTPAQYEELAVRLASEPGLLERVREKLRANRLSAPLFDTVQFTRNLETAYVAAIGRYDEELAPEHIYVARANAGDHTMRPP